MTLDKFQSRAAILNALATASILLTMTISIPWSNTLTWSLGSMVGFLLCFAYMITIYHPKFFREEDAAWNTELPADDTRIPILLAKPMVLALFGVGVLLVWPEHSNKVGWISIVCSMQLANFLSSLIVHRK